MGLIGPAFNALAWREIGIFGYAVVFPVTCLALSRAFAPTTMGPDLLVAHPDVTLASDRESLDLAPLRQ